jgi:hypothetical protein
MLDQQTAQALDGLEKNLALLLDQNSSEQRPQQSDITAQRLFLGWIGRIGSQLRNPALRIVSTPERRFRHETF